MSQCRSCKKTIYWGKTPSGKLCPFDDEAHTISHFTSCSHAEQWSKNKQMSKEKADFYTAVFDLRTAALKGAEDLKNHLWKEALDSEGNPINEYQATATTVAILRRLPDILTPQQITQVIDEVRNAHY